jgi:hypothetical protein
MLFQVGEKQATDTLLCEASGDPSDIQNKCNYTIQPGAYYSIYYHLTSPIAPSDIDKITQIFKDLQQSLPDIGINYVGITDDGKYIIFQIFDPVPVAIIALIIKVIAVIIVAYLAYVTIDKILTFIGQQLPPGTFPSKMFWTSMSIMMAGIGVALIAYPLVKTFGKK